MHCTHFCEALSQTDVDGSVHVSPAEHAAAHSPLTQNSPVAHCEFTAHFAEHSPLLQFGKSGSAHVAPEPHDEPHTVPLVVVMQYGEPAAVQSESAVQVATHAPE